MKNILKKVKGVLKMAKVTIPALVLGGSLVGVFSSVGIIDHAKDMVNDAKMQILQVEEVAQMKKTDLQLNQKRFDEKEITNLEYVQNKTYIESLDYVDDVVKLPQFSEQQETLKQTVQDASSVASIGYSLGFLGTVFSMAGAGMVFSFYCTAGGRSEMKDDIEEGLNDLRY